MDPFERLWIDDEREPPDRHSWWWVKRSDHAIRFIDGLRPREISLDHDLGGEDTTRLVVLWMCEHDVWPEVVRVHTANPVGREWLVGMVNRYGPGVTR